jgi:hypothetical protein
MPTERQPLLGEVVPTFADRGCCVVSATDRPGRILGFLDRSRYYFLNDKIEKQCDVRFLNCEGRCTTGVPDTDIRKQSVCSVLHQGTIFWG